MASAGGCRRPRPGGSMTDSSRSSGVGMTTGEPTAATADQRLVPVTEALALADKYRQSGYLAAAEDLCRQILEARPTHADALHLRGIIAHQTGDLIGAIDYLKQAVAARGNVPLRCSASAWVGRASRI